MYSPGLRESHLCGVWSMGGNSQKKFKKKKAAGGFRANIESGHKQRSKLLRSVPSRHWGFEREPVCDGTLERTVPSSTPVLVASHSVEMSLPGTGVSPRMYRQWQHRA